MHSCTVPFTDVIQSLVTNSLIFLALKPGNETAVPGTVQDSPVDHIWPASDTSTGGWMGSEETTSVWLSGWLTLTLTCTWEEM